MMIDATVRHPRFGIGKIIDKRYGGDEYLVVFSRARIWLRYNAFEIVEYHQGGKKPPPESRDKLPSKQPTAILRKSPPVEVPTYFKCSGARVGDLKSRRMMEAFRLGIVPQDCIDDFNFGRDEEMKKIMAWMGNTHESTVIVEGEYGSGKTHLLNYARFKALAVNYAIAFVEADPNESPFSKPRQIYKLITQSLRFKDREDNSVKGFREFVKKVIEKGGFHDQMFFNRMRYHLDDEPWWQWIEGLDDYLHFYYNPAPPRLQDSGTAGNIYCNLISALGWAAKHVLGLKGLVILFDEAETVSMNTYAYQFKNGASFMRALIFCAADKQELLGPPEKLDGFLTRTKVGDASSLPFLYKAPSGLKLLFAFTPLVDIAYYLRLGNLYSKLPITNLSSAILETVFSRILDLYCTAYDVTAKRDAIIGQYNRNKKNIESTRLFIKYCVELMDLCRLKPNSI